MSPQNSAAAGLPAASHHLIFQQSPTATLLVDRHGACVEANERACTLLGMDRAELLQRAVADLVAPDDPLRASLNWAEPTLAGDYRLDFRAQRGDGSTFQAQLVGRATVDARGQPLHICTLQDISRRRQTEEALVESEVRYRRLFDTMLRGVVYQRADGEIISMNPAAERILGKSKAEFLGESSVTVEHDTLREDGSPFPGLEHPSMVALRTGQVVRDVIMQVYNPRREEYRWISISAVPLFRNEETDPFQVYTIFDDITEQRQAAAAIQERLRLERQLATINAAVPGMICTFRLWPDRSADMPYTSRAVTAIYGLSAEEVARDAAPILARIHPEDAPRVTRSIAESAQALTLWHSEYRYHHPHKGEIWLEVHAMPQRMEDGSMVWHGYIQEITARKRAAERVAELQEILARAESVAGIGSWKWDLRTRKVTWSDEMFTIFGVDRGDFDGDVQSVIDSRIHPDDIEAVNRSNLSVLEAHTPIPIEYRLLLPDGTERVVWAEGRLVHDEHGEPGALMGYVQDITARKAAEAERTRLEAQLRQAQKIEAIGRLAGGIAHDLNNLLVPIVGYTDLSLMVAAPGEKLYNYLQQVRKAADRATDLTRQILAFSRRQVLETRVFDLNTVVLDFQKMLQRLIGEDIEMETWPSPSPCPVEADRGQIEQVLMNLVVNARDAMQDGGQLTIETATVYLDQAYVDRYAETQPPGDYVMLAVSDTGHGMDAETVERIFEPFFTTKEQGKGTGLGLATVFGIVRQHGGNIWVYSEPESGTTFKIYLPLARRDSAAVEPQEEAAFSQGWETILVVEDEEMVRHMVCETLLAHGYAVLEAATPADALQIASGHQAPIHLLLTDVVMPKMNGRRLYQEMAGARPDLKALFMSGYTDNVIVHHGILDKHVNFLQKPFSISQLMRKVRRALG